MPAFCQQRGRYGDGCAKRWRQSSSPAPPPSTGAPPVALVANQSAPAVASVSAVPAVPADPPASLSGYVFFETTPGSPNFSPTSPPVGESPLSGVTVTLTGPSGTETAVTNGEGQYTFSNLTPGTYSLSITAPQGDTSETAVPGGGNGTAGAGTISDITLSSGQSQSNENFPVVSSSVSQVQQIFFTASLLVSGAQIPLAPFEQVVTPAPTPNVPQQMAPPSLLPGLSGRTFVVAGSQSIPQGGSGGDAIIGGANPASPLYSENTQDSIWPAFGEEGVNNWLNEGPEEQIMQQLNNLGDVNLLNGGNTRGSALPFGNDGMDSDDIRGGTDHLDDLLNLNHRGLFNGNDWLDDRGLHDDGIAGGDGPAASDGQGAVAVNGEEVALLDPVVVTPIRIRRLPNDGEWSPGANMSAAAVAAWMLVTNNRGEEYGGRAVPFQRRRKS